MRPFARGVVLTVLVMFASIGGASLLGIDVGVQISGIPETTPRTTESPKTETTSTTTPASDGASDGIRLEAVRADFRSRLNDFRAANDRTALSQDLTLVRAAEAHSRDMAERGYLAHESPEGNDFQDRVRQEGGVCQRGGENVAQTWWRRNLDTTSGPTYIDSESDLAEALFVGWRTSPGHRRVMLIRGVTGMGLDVAMTGSGKIYATLVIC